MCAYALIEYSHLSSVLNVRPLRPIAYIPACRVSEYTMTIAMNITYIRMSLRMRLCEHMCNQYMQINKSDP